MLNTPTPTRPTPSRRDPSPLQLLQDLAPPQTLIHIGAGAGQGELHQWHSWGVPQVLVVDADADRLAWAEPLAAANPNWHISEAIVADVDDTVTYHQASNPAEDGLIPAGPLRAMWPNLRATGQDQRAAQRLDTLLAQAGAPTTAHGNTWLLVDCLPGLSILQGAASTLEQCTTIAVRSLLQSVAGVDTGAALTSVDAFLQGHGFKHVCTLEGHQPAIGHALFVRDWQMRMQTQTRQLSQSNDQLIAENSKLVTDNADLIAQRDAEAAAKAEAVAQLDRLRQQRSKLIADYDQLARSRDHLGLERDQLALEKANLISAHAQLTGAAAELTTQRDAEAQAKAAAIAQRDAQSQLATERQTSLTALQAQIDQLALEKANLIAAHAQLTSAAAELTTQRDAEVQAKTAAIAQRDQEAQAKAEAQAQRDAQAVERNQIATAKDEQTQLATQRQQALTAAQQEVSSLQQRIQQLEAEAQQTNYRQQLQQEEMIKAEAQIELIKDLLLREPGL